MVHFVRTFKPDGPACFTVQRLDLSLRAHSGPVSCPSCLAQTAPKCSGRTLARHPRAATGRRSGHFGTLEGAAGGTENLTLGTEPDRKLGRLPRTRQAVVRVPESNTKYGGKPGKPEVAWRLLSVQVSVSPSGIPSQKNVPDAAMTGFARCSQAKYILRPEGCAGETHVTLRGCGPVCRHARWLSIPKPGRVPPIDENAPLSPA